MSKEKQYLRFVYKFLFILILLCNIPDINLIKSFNEYYKLKFNQYELNNDISYKSIKA